MPRAVAPWRTMASSRCGCTESRSTSDRRTPRACASWRSWVCGCEGMRHRYLHIAGDWRDHLFAVCVDEVPQGLMARAMGGRDQLGYRQAFFATAQSAGPARRDCPVPLRDTPTPCRGDVGHVPNLRTCRPTRHRRDRRHLGRNPHPADGGSLRTLRGGRTTRRFQRAMAPSAAAGAPSAEPTSSLSTAPHARPRRASDQAVDLHIDHGVDPFSGAAEDEAPSFARAERSAPWPRGSRRRAGGGRS